MAPIRYSLHYEDYSEHLMSRFGKLLQMQSLVDMTLMCSSHTLRVHKAVLAASSAYFQEVLQKQSGEPLIILKMRFSVLKSLVEFMYCGKTQCLEENLDELVSAAQFLKIKGLSKVTKEGLGIANSTELPVFTPPVVINRPPQSLIDLHSQDSTDPNQASMNQIAVPTSTGQPMDSLGRSNKDMVVRIPFDIEKGGSGPSNVDYAEPPRFVKPRRGRPSRSGAWETSGALGRAAERALMRREQDSRKAIHQLKHLQTRYSQDYMDRVTLSQAVSSICGPESTTNPNSYMNIDSDFMYMDQNVSSNVLDPTISYSKEHNMSTDTSSYTTTSVTSANDSSNGISSAMSQYVNALKNAGLPTDLPILFESGDGSYINVNEQVLLDMVQSSEIQYEVIEQPNIIENVADPSEIKSIDDLSKSIERGEMMMNTKRYTSTNNYGKEDSQYSGHDDAINSLNAILPDNLESFADQQNYVVLDPRLQGSGNSMDNVNNDFSCIDGDMQYFTKSMSDDVKKYYEGQQLDDSRVMEQLCPTSTTLDSSFSISLLDTKSSHLGSGTMGPQYGSLNHEDLRRNEDCYDFGLQLSQSTDFKEDALDCLMATPKRNTDDTHMDNAAQEREEIIKDLMNIEKNMTQNNNSVPGSLTNTNIDNNRDNTQNNVQDYDNQLNVEGVFDSGSSVEPMQRDKQEADDLSATISSSGIQWDNMDISNKENTNETYDLTQNGDKEQPDNVNSEEKREVIDLTDTMNLADTMDSKAEGWGAVDEDELLNNKENYPTKPSDQNVDSTLNEDIPYAVGLLPLKHIQPTEDNSLLKRRKSVDYLDNEDAKCLKRKVKSKKVI